MKDSAYIKAMIIEEGSNVPEIKAHNKRLSSIAAKLKRLEKPKHSVSWKGRR